MSGEKLLRKLLWLRHGCPHAALYGDDGEMSCGRCIIDFKRDTPEQISESFKRRGREQLEALMDEAGNIHV